MSRRSAFIASCPFKRATCFRDRTAAIAVLRPLKLQMTAQKPFRNVPLNFYSLNLRWTHSLAQRDESNISFEPTIYALSTAAGQAAIAIIRISGPSCLHIYQALCPRTAVPRARYAVVRSIRNPAGQPTEDCILDSAALILFFPGPRTVSGEDILEFHVHGGPAVVKAVLGAIASCNKSSTPIRYAEPGEFTRRAFMNGRMDLPQVEALAGTLSAITEEQRRLSVQSTIGGLASRYESWRQQLLDARGELEALIDFSEDQHFDESPLELVFSVAKQVKRLAEVIRIYNKNAVKGELLRHGITISLIGSPNVGKSSLLNQIVGRHAAIVSNEAGTTRDIVEVAIDLAGFYCRFGDTAGIRCVKDNALLHDAVGEIEQEGIKRAKARAMESDVIVLVMSIESSINSQGTQLCMDEGVLATATQLLELGKEVVVVVNKMDQYGTSDSDKMIQSIVKSVETALPRLAPKRVFCISCRQAEASHHGSDSGNFQTFLNGLVEALKAITVPLMSESEEVDLSVWSESLGVTERQRLLLESCLTHLQDFETLVMTSSSAEDVADNEIDIVVGAESLRAAATDLAKITGRGEASDVEEVLGVVFEKFCVGK